MGTDKENKGGAICGIVHPHIVDCVSALPVASLEELRQVYCHVRGVGVGVGNSCFQHLQELSVIVPHLRQALRSQQDLESSISLLVRTDHRRDNDRWRTYRVLLHPLEQRARPLIKVDFNNIRIGNACLGLLPLGTFTEAERRAVSQLAGRTGGVFGWVWASRFAVNIVHFPQQR